MAQSIDEIRKLYPYSDDCFVLEKTIEKIANEKSYYSSQRNKAQVSVLDKRLDELNSFFAKKGCELVIGSKLTEELVSLKTKYSEIDKIRIEAESFEQRNKRIYIGVVVLLLGLGIVLIRTKK